MTTWRRINTARREIARIAGYALGTLLGVGLHLAMLAVMLAAVFFVMRHALALLGVQL